jgi:RNA polymerase sigma-70 factor, ECF subfamily
MEARDETEHCIRAACTRADYERAATLAVETYGREILSFLIARLGQQRGHDVFSDFLEDLWRGLTGFSWRCTLRTWLYTLARNAVARHLSDSQRRQRQIVLTTAALSAVGERVRTETAAHLKTEVKDRLRELRAQLSDDDQVLLILRIDRNLRWRELALVMSDPDSPRNESDIDTICARLRQRFQAAKERLRNLAESEGLIGRHDDESSV